MRCRGLTLLELLLALAMTALIVAAGTSAYSAAMGFDQSARTGWDTHQKQVEFESRLRELLRGAFVSTDTANTMDYLVGETIGSSGSANVTGSDTLTFTTTSEPINGVALQDTTDDFPTLNQRFGAQGGLSEVELTMTPVGTGAGDKQGIFIREQRPSDGDRTQGGYEQLFSGDVTAIGFEFYTGTDWVPTWDTTTDTTRRIPAAIRVTYTLAGEGNDQQHQLIVALPNSDATADNPVTTQTGGTTQ